MRFMTDRVELAGLKVARQLVEFLANEALPGTGVSEPAFWDAFSAIVHDLAPRNRALLRRRDELQKKIDGWHRANGAPSDLAAYKRFLKEIGYLLDAGPAFSVSTDNVDPEIAFIAGPQLVVPVMNARYALNAANARWGSLYDALYGTDAIPDTAGAGMTQRFNPLRGQKVIAWGRNFLDAAFPLRNSSWSETSGIAVAHGALVAGSAVLDKPSQFAGYRGSAAGPDAVLLKNNGLHVEILIDRDHPIGRSDKAGIADIVLEAALSAIQDCEDSIAAVDAEDKVAVYRNWLGLMKGDLVEEIEKSGKTFTRRLNRDRSYTAPDGTTLTLPGRAVMLVRNVGHLMTNPAILDRDGNEVPEGIMDAMITSLIALHDVGPNGRRANSRAGSVSLVKPKMHGPEEVAFAVELFGRVEGALGMQPNTLKMGVMDEERRTTVNLGECIRAARERVVFINTGFLDRTGDEIH